MLWFNFLSFFSVQPPAIFSLALVPGEVIGALLVLGPVLLFLFLFVKRSEKKISLKAIVASVGMNRRGIGQSLFWSVPAFGLIVLAEIVLGMVVTSVFGPHAISYPYQSSLPLWYSFRTMIYSVFSSLTEETVGVGYIVDRLMPAHPASLAESAPAVLARSLIAVVYHIGTYFMVFHLSPLVAMANFVSAFVAFTIIGFAYVRSRVQNVCGPWVTHYLLDVLMVFETYTL
jgi:hypothetical protein